jgi:phage terminase large subunit GpA-like protein
MAAPSSSAPSEHALAAQRMRATAVAARTIRTRIRLPPKLTLSEWADRYRVLSPEASARPGPWQTARTPYLREIMDTISGRDYQDITVVKSSQSAGSEAILNACGFFMDQEPSSILVIQPNVKPMAEAFSKSRIAPMVRDCSRLRGKVKDPRSRDSGNTVLQKSFPGGTLFIMGANSPAGLASNPIRCVFADELDRWPASAGTEGDPLGLAEARQITYRHRRKTVKVSSPSNEGESRIEKEWRLSDQRHYYVPCPHCGHEQPLEWRDSAGKPDIRPKGGTYRLIWEKEGEHDAVVHKTDTAAYVCRECACTIEETHKPAMLAAGRWVKHNPSSRRAGFHISGLLSPWVRWSEVAAKWIAVKDDDEQRKTFFNTLLGLLYVQTGEVPDATQLSNRREKYGAEVPRHVALLTAGIDVQGDRIEVEVRGWADREESYQIRLERLYGDPEQADVWERAGALLDRPWQHESGAELRIRSCMVDSGYLQDAVFGFVKSRAGNRVFASKGVENAKAPLSRASKANRDGIKVFTINPNALKDVLFRRLARASPGPGYLHFGTEAQTGADDAYFLQFGAEKRIVEFVNNRPVVRYINPAKKRNEAIDLYVLTLAALRSLGMNMSQRLGKEAKRVQAEGDARRAAAKAAEQTMTETPNEPEEPSPPPPRRSRGGWMRGFGR